MNESVALATDSAPGEARQVLDLIYGFRRSKTLFAAVDLGIFEGLRPRARALQRLLAACASLGLLERRDGGYVNTAVANRYLCESSPDSLVGYIRYSNRALYPLWQHLEDAVREGTPRWRQTFGEERGPAEREATFTSRDFTLGMHGLGLLSSAAIVRQFDLSGFSTLADLGGATGHLALAARARYPALRIVVMDHQAIVEIARQMVPADVTFVAGDFCTDPLPPADLFVLGRILHHRSDANGKMLLRRLFDALPVGGGVLVIEAVVDEEGGSGDAGSSDAHMHALSMLVSSTDGNERSVAEYQSWLRQVGFRDVRGGKTETPLGALLAIK